MIGFIKDYGLPLLMVLLLFIFIGVLCYSSGQASKIVLERHGYEMTWWQAMFIDVEELCGDKDMDMDVRLK